MQNEESLKVIRDLISGIGTMAVEYWDGRTARKATDALDHLELMATQAQAAMDMVDAEPHEPLVEAIERWRIRHGG